MLIETKLKLIYNVNCIQFLTIIKSKNINFLINYKKNIFNFK